MKKLMSLLLMLSLFAPCALAVTLDRVESAPDVEIILTETTPVSGYYLPDESYLETVSEVSPGWADEKTYFAPAEALSDTHPYYTDTARFPALTHGEIERANVLKKAFASGERTGNGESILNKTENIVLGVFAVNPDEFDGEPFYHILPGTSLTDEDILNLIDAYAQSGLEFMPEALTYKNTMRGGCEETNRYMQREEYERMHALEDMIRYGYVEEISLASPLSVSLDMRYYRGLNHFTLYPYRSMTDEELVSLLVNMGYHDESDKYDFAGIEKEARKALNRLLSVPLSMQRDNIFTEGGIIIFPVLENGETDFDKLDSGEGIHKNTYGASFWYIGADGNEIDTLIHFDWETGAVLSASSMPYLNEEAQIQKLIERENAAPFPITEKEIAQAEALTGNKDLTWFAQEGEVTTNWGQCREIKALTPDGYWLSVFIGTDDGEMRGLNIQISKEALEK